jgi:hypothetical protein
MIIETGNTANAVEIAPDAGMVDTGDPDGVIDVVDEVHDRSPGVLLRNLRLPPVVLLEAWSQGFEPFIRHDSRIIHTMYELSSELG